LIDNDRKNTWTGFDQLPKEMNVG